MAMLAWPLTSRADSMRHATWARVGSATVVTRTDCPAYDVQARVDLRRAREHHVLAELAGQDVDIGEVPGGSPVEQGE